MRLRDFLWIAVAMLTLPVLTAADLGGFLQPEASGGFKIDEITFRLMHFGKDWRLTRQNDKSVLPAAGSPEIRPDQFHLEGNFQVLGGVIAVDETITAPQPNEVKYQLKLHASPPVETNDLAVETLLPVDRFLDRPILADGRKINFGAKREGKSAHVLRVRKLEITLGNGILTVTGNFQIQFQDNRTYNLQEWSLRIQPDRQGAVTADTGLALQFIWQPNTNVPVDISKVANTGFADETAGDSKGGWSDQGPDKDLHMFPATSAEYAGIPFRILDPVANGGKAVIALRGKTGPKYPESVMIELDKPLAAQSLYLLHAIAGEPDQKTRIGTVRCEYAEAMYTEKAEQLFPVMSGESVADFWMPRWIENAAVGWQQRDKDTAVGLYVTRFALSGKPVKRIVLESAGEAQWLIPALTLSDRAVNFKKELPVVMQPSAEWQPIVNRKDVKAGSILDFSGLLDAQAGKYGFARNVNGNIEFERRPGYPVRFYGANVCFDANFLEKDLTRKMVDNCAKLGYNVIRLHHYDAFLVEKDNLTLKPDKLDQFDFLLSELKSRGIYTTIDLFSLRTFPAGSFPELPNAKIGEHDFKMLIFLSDSAMKNYQQFAASLLNHVNPYTKLAWKDDPAVVSMCMINEDTIFSTFSWVTRKLVQERFEQWLAERKLTPSEPQREKYRKLFLMELYDRGYRQLDEFYRGLKVRSMITDQNMWSTPAVSLMRERYDLVDNHFYWAHPQFEGTWGLPATVNTESAIRDFGGSVSKLFATRLYGKPFSVTEWDYVNPNPYAVEGAFLTGAYASLQDWNMLCRFTYCDYPAAQQLTKDHLPNGFFAVINDPLRRLSEIAGVLAFTRKDVKPATANFPFILSRSHFTRQDIDLYPMVLTRLGLIGKTGTVLSDSGGQPALPVDTRAVFGFAGEWKADQFTVPFLDSGDEKSILLELQKSGTISGGEYNPDTESFCSSTGELTLNRKLGTFMSVTARSESFVLGEEQTLDGKFASVRNSNAFAAYLIASYDGRPLAESNRMLLLHLTNARNTNEKFRNGDCNVIESWGQSPVLIRKGKGEVTIRRDLRGFNLYAVGLDGARLEEVPFEVKNHLSTFVLSTLKATGVSVAYELVRADSPDAGSK